VQYVEDKRQAQVRHLDGDLEGLKEWVRPPALQCEWSGVQALIRLEAKALALAHSPEAEALPAAVADAANEVFAATGEDLYVEQRGISDGARDAIERVARRSGLDDQQARDLFRPPAYTDQPGSWQLPSIRLLSVAQRFAAAEAGLVNLHLESEIASYRERGYETGERYLHKLLIDKGPAYALAREWAGSTRIAEDLRKDNERLRKLLREAMSVLRRHGHERDALKFERELHSG
jgi:hypothetical protein